MYTRLLLIAVSYLALTGAACAGEAIVDQDEMHFLPETLTIKAGDTVHFKNSASIIHNIFVAAPDDSDVEDVGLEKPGQVMDYNSFTKPGLYRVRCNVHPMMKLKIYVD